MKVEVLEKNKRRMIFEVSAERFEEGLNYAYNKNKTHINIAGFRRGKAPRKLIETQFGKEVFYEDAIDFILPVEYRNAVREAGLDTVASPEFTNFEVQPDKSVVFTAEVFVKPEVLLGNYKGLKYKPMDTEPTEAEITAQIDEALEKNTREISVSDRPAEDGDIVIIDFDGYVDGERFENGSGMDYELTIGSHTFIDNFEEQLIGHEIGEEVKVAVRFPDEYHATELSGKDAVFNVVINEIKKRERPVLDDEFASDVSEFDTLDEYREDLAKSIREAKIDEAGRDKEAQLIYRLVEGCEIDVPEVMIENQMDTKLHEFMHNIQDRGLDFGKYLEYIGKTREDMRESFRDISTSQIKGNLALMALAEAEGLKAEDSELDEMINKYKEAGIKLSDAELIDFKDEVAEEMKLRKAITFLAENAVESDEIIEVESTEVDVIEEV